MAKPLPQAALRSRKKYLPSKNLMLKTVDLGDKIGYFFLIDIL